MLTLPFNIALMLFRNVLFKRFCRKHKDRQIEEIEGHTDDVMSDLFVTLLEQQNQFIALRSV